MLTVASTLQIIQSTQNKLLQWLSESDWKWIKQTNQFWPTSRNTTLIMEESTLILAKKIAEQSITDDADAAEALDGSPKPLRKMQGKLQGFR